MGKNVNISKPKLNKKPFKVKRHNKNPISETKIKKKVTDSLPSTVNDRFAM